MSQSFKLNFDQMHEGNAEKQETDHMQNDKYQTDGHVRNLCFEWPDGQMKFLNYAYLVLGEYLPEEDTIILKFTTNTAIVKGQKLKTLFKELLFHLPKRIVCFEDRYSLITDEQNYAVKEISVIENN